MLGDRKEFAQPVGDATQDRIIRRVALTRGYNYKFHAVPQGDYLRQTTGLPMVPRR